jgi:hypothetical protein
VNVPSARLRSLLGTTLLFLAGTSPAIAQTADDLIAKNLAARGGVDKLRAVRTMHLSGTISFGEQASPIDVKAKSPSQIREDFAIQGTNITRAYDGSRGWQAQKKDAQNKIEELTGGEADNIREEAENAIAGPLLDYSKEGSKVESLGRDTYDGKPVFKLKITTHMGTTITQYLDAATYLEVHEDIERSANGKLMLIVEDVSDYREVSGVKYAHRFVSGSKDNPKASTFQVDKMELNVPVDATEFAMPK